MINKILFLSIIFLFSSINTLAQDSTLKIPNTGIDILISDNGMGLGIYYRYEFDELSGYASFSISSYNKENNSYEYLQYSRIFLIPLSVGIQYRLFSEYIEDNVRPYFYTAFGPSIIYSAPALEFDNSPYSLPKEKEFFSSVFNGQLYYGYNLFFGLGSFIKYDKNKFFSISFRYCFLHSYRNIVMFYNFMNSNYIVNSNFNNFSIIISLPL
jgi:hypothetical protein